MWLPFLIYTPDDARGHQIRPVRRETGSGDRKIPASEKTWGTRRRDILVPLFSPRLLSLGPGGAGVGRIGGGTFSPPVRVGVGKPPLLFAQDFAGPGPVGELLRKTWGTLGGGTFLSPSSPRLLSLGSGGAGVARIGGGTFSPPVGVGVGKPPLLFAQDFAGPGPVGELLSGGGTFLSPRPRTTHHGFAPGMPATEMGPQGSQQVFRRLVLAAALQGSRRGRRIQSIHRVSGSRGKKTPAPGPPTRRLGRSSSEG